MIFLRVSSENLRISGFGFLLDEFGFELGFLFRFDIISVVVDGGMFSF